MKKNNMKELELNNIKEVVKKIDTTQIKKYISENPSSKKLKRIIRDIKIVLEGMKEIKRTRKGGNEEIVEVKVFEKDQLKRGEQLAYSLDAVVNFTDYIKDKQVKVKWIELANELSEVLEMNKVFNILTKEQAEKLKEEWKNRDDGKRKK